MTDADAFTGFVGFHFAYLLLFIRFQIKKHTHECAKKIARVKRNLRLDTRMTQIDVILLFDGITLLQGIAEEKEKCNASASANFVQVLCKHFPLFYIIFSKVIPTFARKTLFFAILARFFTIFWLFSGSFWSWGGRGRTFKSCHSDQQKREARKPPCFAI